MNIQNKRELEMTRKKLRGLEEVYAATQTAAGQNAYGKQLTLRSVRRTINQLKEEIARFEARAGSAARSE
jgi:hypothetical protein